MSSLESLLVTCFSKTLVYGLFSGLMYYNVGDGLNFGTSDRYASHFFIMAALVFVPAYAAVTLWDNERKLLKVETNRKSYSILSYFLAKTGTTWPMEIFLSLVMCLIVYWMIGNQSKRQHRDTFCVHRLPEWV